jgi:hypothetical protein
MADLHVHPHRPAHGGALYFPLIITLSAAPTLAPRALLLLALMVLQCSTDLVYITPAVLIPVSAVAIWHLARRATRPAGARLMIVAIAAGITVLAIHFPYLRVAASNPHLAQQTNWRLDPMRNAVEMPGGLLSLMSPFDVPSLALLLVVAVAALVLWRGWRGSPRELSLAGHALLWVIVGLLISLPLRIDVLGSVWTLPHVLAAQRWIPFAAAIRLPERLRVAALMGITLLAGIAFAELLRHLASLPALHARARWVANGLAMLLAVAMYGRYVAAVGQPRGYGPPLPAYQLQEPPRDDSAVLRALRAAGGATIEVPLPPGQPTAAAAHAPAMYRSIFHWQPLLNGYSSYWPVDFAARMKVATRLPDPDALAQLQRETGLAYVLVRASEQLPIDAKPHRNARRAEIARNGGRSDLTPSPPATNSCSSRSGNHKGTLARAFLPPHSGGRPGWGPRVSVNARATRRAPCLLRGLRRLRRRARRRLDATQEAHRVRRHEQALARTVGDELVALRKERFDRFVRSRSPAARHRVTVEHTVLDDHVAAHRHDWGVGVELVQHVLFGVQRIEDHHGGFAVDALLHVRNDLRRHRAADEKIDALLQDRRLAKGLRQTCDTAMRNGAATRWWARTTAAARASRCTSLLLLEEDLLRDPHVERVLQRRNAQPLVLRPGLAAIRVADGHLIEELAVGQFARRARSGSLVGFRLGAG